MCVYIDVYVNIYIYLYKNTISHLYAHINLSTDGHSSLFPNNWPARFSVATMSWLQRNEDDIRIVRIFPLPPKYGFEAAHTKMLGASLQPCLLFHDMQKLVVGTNVTSIGAFNSVTKPRFHFYASENGVPGLVNIQKNMENHHFLAG